MMGIFPASKKTQISTSAAYCNGLHPVFTSQTVASRAGVLAGKYDRAMCSVTSLPTVSVAVDCNVSSTIATAPSSTESDTFTGSNLFWKT